MKNKKVNILTAIRLWALNEGFQEIAEEISEDRFTAVKDNLKTTFITEFDKSKDELLESIEKIKSDFIYVVTDDNAKRRELLKIIPDYCGILFHGNPFGLGLLSMVFKEPTLIK